MSKSSHLSAALLGLGLVLLPGAGASAAAQTMQPAWTMPHRGGEGRAEPVQARVMALRQLIAIVSSQRPGQFVDVVGGLEQRGDRAFYIFRWRYPSGEEVNLRVDATTGQVG